MIAHALEETIDDRLDLLGIAALSDTELLGLLWDEETPIPSRLLANAGGLRALAAAGAAELSAMHGIGRRRAQALAAAFELGRRTDRARKGRGTVLTSSLDVFRHFRSRLRDERCEVFAAALLDVKNRLLREVRVSTGSLSASLVHPREAFGAAVREPAHAVLFAHNHPSGDPTPSDEDVRLTRRLVEAGEVLGIRVLDHVVVGDDEYYSFADAGKLK